MDITPIYELRSRLRGAAIAGTGLISEDFRLKKAAEAFSELSGGSPVFAKLDGLVKKLLCADQEGAPDLLIDALTLADAVIVTLGSTRVSGEPETITGGSGTANVNAPYSKLFPLINALTVSGSGGYSVFTDTLNYSPELLNDYRVRPALIKGLGAAYSALAAEVAKYLPRLGEEIVPLLKKDFDNKGKKEMVYRVEIIGSVSGAKENGFYLTQLETAEKDVKNALITALRFDKNNFEKLTSLVKTEKGESKKSALRAVLYMDDERAMEYLREYSKKKPGDVLELLNHVSTEMTSRLAAEIINGVLTDKDGNKVSISQAVTTEAIKSDIDLKASWSNIHGALCGKYGKEIEPFYRDFYTEDDNYAAAMDRCLGNSILVSGDDGLKQLALELNNKSKMKGRYVYSEAVVRLTGGEDSEKWFDQKLKALPPNSNANVNILEAMTNLVFENGNYAITVNSRDAVGQWIKRTVPVKASTVESLVKLMLKYFNNQPNLFMMRLQVLVDPENKSMCKNVGDFILKEIDSLYKQNAVDKFSNMNLMILERCGYKNIKGLAQKLCRADIQNWRLNFYINSLPGDKAYKLEEAKEIIRLARAGKLKFKNLNIDNFEQWSEKEFM